MGGSRNEAIGLVVVLLILTLIAAAFFWESARSKGAIAHPYATTSRDDAALRLDYDVASPHYGLSESWTVRAPRQRPVERLALSLLSRSDCSI
jgi:hypothetical protein